tara:strand:+ start:789 stop:1070 length:282 start_codon:yes stop_codon:yes gene_type:complete
MPRTKDGKPILYKPFKNTGKGYKKFFVYVKSDNKQGYKKIGFGDNRYEDFRQHKDKKRQASFRARMKGIKKKDGSFAYKDKTSPAYWSLTYLW